MKIGAHPLVVAVALGFLNPAALASEPSERDAEARCDDDLKGPCEGCTCDAAVADEVDPLDVGAMEDAWMSMARPA